MKCTLQHLLSSSLIGEAPILMYSKLPTVLSEAANIANDRPVGVKTLTEEDLLPLTVNHLLFGRNSTHRLSYDEAGDLMELDEIKEHH